MVKKYREESHTEPAEQFNGVSKVPDPQWTRAGATAPLIVISWDDHNDFLARKLSNYYSRIHETVKIPNYKSSCQHEKLCQERHISLTLRNTCLIENGR